jgi:putative DNA primase/helicase
MPNYSNRDVETEFIEFLNKLGIPPENAGGNFPILDGRKHRYQIAGDHARHENGEYCVYLDEWPAGYAKSYSAKHNVEYATWSLSSGGMEYTEEEKLIWRKKREEEVKQRTEEEQKRRDYAAKNAAISWENATESGVIEHAYIVKKGITNVRGVKLLGREIIVPLYDSFGAIHNIQRINVDGEKRFLSGGRKRGCFYRLDGDVRNHVFICEGLATGLSIREATGCACIVAFDAGNIESVVSELVANGHINLVLAADNDFQTKGNPGINAAVNIANEHVIPVVVPVFEIFERVAEHGVSHSDWNDYVSLYGVEAAAESIYKQIEDYLFNKNAPRRQFIFPDLRENLKGVFKPIPTLGNINYLFKHKNIECKYNEISRSVEISIPGKKYSSDNERNAVIADITSLLIETGLKVDSKLLKAYITKIADVNSYNPAADYVLSSTWRGDDAIRDLTATLSLGYGCPPEWAELMLKKWLISGVAAAFSRGMTSKDTFWSRGVLVLCGPQAVGKTSWFRRIFPQKLFSEGVSLSLDNKDDVKRAISSWGTELGELDGTFKRSDMARLKAFLSNQYDDIRTPYAEASERLVRRTIFCASVNRQEILQDETGSSRWWIIPVINCDINHKVDIAQVWAQAYELYRCGEQWWLTKDEEAELSLHNEQFEPSNKFEDLILSRFNFEGYRYDSHFNLDYTAMEVLKICGVQNPPPGECISCSAVLRKLTGHASVRNGKTGRRIFRLPPEFSWYNAK